jgi:hypothetical protein
MAKKRTVRQAYCQPDDEGVIIKRFFLSLPAAIRQWSEPDIYRDDAPFRVLFVAQRRTLSENFAGKQ